MYTEVDSKLTVPYSSSPIVPLYSQAVSMAGGNAIMAEITCFHWSYSGSTPMLEITAEEGNDLENWDDISNSVAGQYIEADGEGYFTLQISEIAGQYVRLKFKPSVGVDGGTAVVAAGINVANL